MVVKYAMQSIVALRLKKNWCQEALCVKYVQITVLNTYVLEHRLCVQKKDYNMDIIALRKDSPINIGM